MSSLYSKCLFYHYRDLSINVCSIIICFFLVIILYIFFFVRFSFCYRYNGLVLKDGDQFYVSIMVSDNELMEIQNYSFIMEKREISYNIINISDEYILTDSGLKRQVLLDFEFGDDNKIVNNVLELIFIDKKTFFRRLKEDLNEGN